MIQKYINKALNMIETVGNKLPHPATLFMCFTMIIIVISFIGSAFDWQVTYNGVKMIDGVPEVGIVSATIKNLISLEGIRFMFSSVVKNFTGFAPLGTVMVSLVGISIAERSGLISAVLRKLAISTPQRFITSMIVFLGIMSNVASDAGYIVLPPLAAMIFISFKRHPIAGIAAAFSGVSGGYSANLLLSSLDPLLAGFSEEAAHILNPTYSVNPASNWYFMAASVIVIVIAGTFVTEKIVEPRCKVYTGEKEESYTISDEENSALKHALIAFVVVSLLCFGLYHILSSSVFFGDAMVFIIVLVFLFPGIAYGMSIQTIKSDEDVMKMIADSFSTMGSYLVLVFFAAQFIAFFTYSNLGTILAVNGANMLKLIQLPPFILIVVFILIVAFINLFMGSASAKYAILAPIFIPIMMELGISAELTQLAYRIGDSTTNIISPLMSYFPMVLIYMKRYDKNASIGTLISTMLPYSIVYLIAWISLLGLWMLLNLPIGISGSIFL